MGLGMARMDWLGKNMLKLVGIDKKWVIFIKRAFLGAKSAVVTHRAKMAPFVGETPPYPPFFLARSLLLE